MRQKPFHYIPTCHFLLAGLCILSIVARSEVRAEEKIRIGLSTHSPGFLPTVIAEKKGFYAKYGLAPEHILISISVGMNALGTGDLSYSNGLAQSVLASIRGVPVKLVMFTQEKLVFFLVAKPQFQKVTDLRGKTIGISYYGSSTHMVAEGILRHYGLVPGKDINVLPSGDDQGRLAALDVGRIDAAVGIPPLDIVAAKKGYKILARAGDYLKLPQNGIIVTDKKLETSPDQVKRMIKGTIEALQFIKNRREEATEILAQWSRVDKETAKAIFASYAPGYSTDGTMTEEGLQAALEEGLTRAKMEKKLPLSQIADGRLLSEAQKELGLK
jgi:ABC-type nitrate/sulfonate/bicarbonate transport system substrate-binding protein